MITYEGSRPGPQGARVLVHLADGPVALPLRHDLYRHADHVAWGTTLAAAKQLGLALLAHALACGDVEAVRQRLAPEQLVAMDAWARQCRVAPADALAYWLHQRFAAHFVRHLPRDGFRASLEDIQRAAVMLASRSLQHV